jgi:hypothetical protein
LQERLLYITVFPCALIIPLSRVKRQNPQDTGGRETVPDVNRALVMSRLLRLRHDIARSLQLRQATAGILASVSAMMVRLERRYLRNVSFKLQESFNTADTYCTCTSPSEWKTKGQSLSYIDSPAHHIDNHPSEHPDPGNKPNGQARSSKFWWLAFASLGKAPA